MATVPTTTPNELRVSANGLTHRVLEWTAAARADDVLSKRTLFLIHGWMDTAATWDLVAPTLVAAGYRVLAPDMRGFGGSDRAPKGSYYHFADYLADFAGIADALVPSSPFVLVGHSMGGTIVTLYAAARPQRVERLAVLEGTGPGDNDFDRGAARLPEWLDQLAASGESADARLAAMHRHVPAPEATMLRRLVRSHGNVKPDVLASRLVHLIERAPGAKPDEDAFVWAADPRHKMTSPTPFFAGLYKSYAARIACPTLIVDGGTTGYKPADDETRRAAFKDATTVTLEGAGHMMHWTQPDALASAIVDFTRRPSSL